MARVLRRCVALVVAVVVALVVFLSAERAHAALMHDTDLASLALLSDQIVRASKVSDRPGAHGSTLSTFRVDHVYRGTLASGDTVELDVGLYGLAQNPFEPHRDSADEAGPRVLFLRQPKPSAPADEHAPEPKYYVVGSGMRVLIEGRVQRFRQWSNPGGFAPVPQGPDPCDRETLAPCDDAVDLARFEADLRRAIERAESAKRVLEAEPASIPALLELVGTADRGLNERRGRHGPYDRDEIATRAAHRLWELGGFDEILEMQARLRERALDVGPRVVRFDDARFVEVARSPQRSLRERLAAIHVLRESSSLSDTERASFASLLDDPHPSVRRDVWPLLERHSDRRRLRDWLRARYQRELDAELMIDLVHMASVHQMLPFEGAPALKLPVVFASRHGDWVEVRWAVAEPPAPELRRFAFEWRGPEGTRVEDRVVQGLGSSSTASAVAPGVSVPLSLHAARAATDYELAVVVGLASERGSIVELRAELGKLRTPEGLPVRAPEAPSADAPDAASSASPAASAVSAPSEPAPAAPAGGCGCVAAGRTVHERTPSSSAVLLALATLAARRRSRARACSRAS